MSGRKDSVNVLRYTNLRQTTNNGGRLRFADLSTVLFDDATVFRNAFLDGSVVVTPEFRAQMGNPCQWVEDELDDEEYYGSWRGWIEIAPDQFDWLTWEQFAPESFEDVLPFDWAAEDCEWKTEQMPGASE